MARILITGSSDGIGLSAARTLINYGHSVTLHARNPTRAAQASEAAPGNSGVLTADISTLKGMHRLASAANASGPFDVVVQNAGVGFAAPVARTPDGFRPMFAINALAPYVLTALMAAPTKAAIFLSSRLHYSARADLHDVDWAIRTYEDAAAYGESNFFDVLLAFAFARSRRFEAAGASSVAINPGKVRTKMNGSSAPRTIESGADTIVWLVDRLVAGDGSIETARLYKDREVVAPHAEATDTAKQDDFMKICARLSGVEVPVA